MLAGTTGLICNCLTGVYIANAVHYDALSACRNDLVEMRCIELSALKLKFNKEKAIFKTPDNLFY